MSSQKTIRRASRKLANARLQAAYATLSDRQASPQSSSADLLRDLEKDTVDIIVAARSSNTNSFGLREHVLVLRDGQTFRALRSAYSPDAGVWQVGARLQVVVSRDATQPLYVQVCGALARQGFECVSVVPVLPRPEVTAKLWK